ncbi:MAG: SDR family oxidoreductase [Gammaproteobacteria bacterium]|nr:SDR family oxidoreductase [Gammaproteobacteria bacterium]MDD9875376.1 SDR family oxidoreductase [Gammaproteobacteria bacterium]
MAQGRTARDSEPTGGADTRLAGKISVVTGAAQGIGLAIARRFAAAGARVIVADVNPPPHREMVFRRTDVSCEEEVRALVDFAVREYGGIDVLVNNAGIALEKPIEHTEVAEWERVMAVNVRGVFLCAKHALGAMRGRGGAIVNIGSIEAHGANPLHAAYAASKGAVHSLTRNIALEYGADNIRCNAVAPGWIDTPFNENFIAQHPDPEQMRAAVRALHPLGRIGAPQDIAEVVLWLASDAARFASGQVYVHDGGRTACLPLPALPGQ